MMERNADPVLREIIAAHQAAPAVRPSTAAPALNRLSGVKAVLFDVYGTLLLSERNNPGPDGRPDKATLERLKTFAVKYGIALEAERLVPAFLDLIDTTNKTAAARGVGVPEVNVIHIWHRLLGGGDYRTLKRLALEFEMIVHRCRPAGDLAALFAFLRSKDIRLGIVSNAQFYTAHILEYWLGRPLTEAGFDKKLILYSYIYRHAKPSAKLFRKAVTRVTQRGLHPAQVLFAGDSLENDIQPAGRAGFQTALFCGSAATVRPAADLRIDAVLTDWNQIEHIL